MAFMVRSNLASDPTPRIHAHGFMHYSRLLASSLAHPWVFSFMDASAVRTQWSTQRSALIVRVDLIHDTFVQY
jgi:hypothetical protein